MDDDGPDRLEEARKQVRIALEDAPPAVSERLEAANRQLEAASWAQGNPPDEPRVFPHHCDICETPFENHQELAAHDCAGPELTTDGGIAPEEFDLDAALAAPSTTDADERLRCTDCGQAAVRRKVGAPEDREHPEPYRCFNCGAHVEEPVTAPSPEAVRQRGQTHLGPAVLVGATLFLLLVGLAYWWALGGAW